MIPYERVLFLLLFSLEVENAFLFWRLICGVALSLGETAFFLECIKFELFIGTEDFEPEVGTDEEEPEVGTRDDNP